jgi:hypothetical protein
VHYVHEPFNISSPACACGIEHRHWFCYVSSSNEDAVRRHIEHCLGGVSLVNVRNAFTQARITRRLRPLVRVAKSGFAARVLMKDPLAVFSAEWLESTFNMDAVVVIRHPAAVASSYKELNWSHPFSHFLEQPALIREHLHPFEDEIRDFAVNRHDVVDQAALLWKLIYYMVRQYRDAHPDWVFVRHMDLAADPLETFRWILDRLDLKSSPRLERQIRLLDTESHGTEDPYSIHRNGKAASGAWRRSLTPDEVRRIRRRVEEVSSAFYADDEW